MDKNQQAHTVLVFRIGSLGDTLVAMPAFHLIRQKYPNSRIVLLTNSPVDGGIKAAPSYQILLGSGLVDEYIEYRHRSKSVRALKELAKTVRKLRPAKGYYLMPQRRLGQRLRDAVFFAWSGIVGMRGLWPGKKGNRHLVVRNGSSLYESEASRLLRSVGLDPRCLRHSLYSLRIRDIERESIAPILEALEGAGPIMAISIGAKVPVNDWGDDRWLDFIKRLPGIVGRYSLIFLGTADEHARCERLLMSWSYKGRNLCGRLSPRQSAAVLEKATFFVGHDSGPMHLAAAVGIPCVAIFSSRNPPGEWFPYGEEHEILYQSIECQGCRLSVCEARKKACINSISVEMVLRRVEQLMRRCSA